METTYGIKEENGIYQLMKGRAKVKTPRKSLVCTRSQDLAEWLQHELTNGGDQWTHLFYVRFLHYAYCDSLQLTEEEVEQTREWIKEVIYQDPFWGFNEPMCNRKAVVDRYVANLPDVIMDLPRHVMLAFINWANATGSILLVHHVLNTLLDEDSPYSLDDMDEFVDELIEYGDNAGFSMTTMIPWEADYLKASIRTLVIYCSYAEV